MRRTSRRVAKAILVTVLASPVHAHVDPPGCAASGVALIVGMYRGDGPRGLVGAASECERVSYRVTLQKADPSTCAVSGGTLTLTLPDGTMRTLAETVPCIGAAGSHGGPCPAATASFASAAVPYVIRPGDAVSGILSATARYEGGVVHDGDRDTPGIVLSADRRAELVACDDGDPATTDVCDPNAPGAAACSHVAALPASSPPCPFSRSDDVLVCEPTPCGAP